MRSVRLRMLDLLRINQQKAEFVGTAYGTELSVSETFILVELDLDPSRTSKAISEIFNVDKSTVSRSIAGLAKNHYLQIEVSKKDRRKHSVALTDKGRDFLALHDAANAKQLSTWSANVTLEELAELQLFLKTFADGCGANSTTLRAQESVLLLEMRRLTHAFGLLGPAFAGSQYSATVWQILSEIEYGAHARRAIDLCKLFLMKPNTLSQALSRLERLRIISKKRSSGDRRNYSLALTAKGKQALEQIEKCAEQLIAKGFSAMTAEQIERFLSLFGKYIGVGVWNNSGLQPALTAARLTSDDERRQARSFLVYHYVRSNRFTDLPETLAGEDGFVFALRNGGKFAAICEFQKGENYFILANMAVSPEAENSAPLETFLLQSQRKVLSETGNMPILIPRSSEAIRFLRARTRMSELPGYLEFLN